MIKIFKRLNIVLLVAFINCVFLNSLSLADAYESSDHIKDVIKNFVSNNITLASDETMDVQFDQVASLTLPTCTSEIIASLPKDNIKQEITSVDLTCNGVNSWHVFVPVHVAIYMKVLVAKQNIIAQDTINESDIEIGMFDKNRLYNGYYKNNDEVIGKVANQMIPAGSVINKKNIQAPIIIHRNQSVDITATSNTVSVSMKGIAKSDGALNDTIQVFNPSSKRTLDALVVGPNKAEVMS